MAVTAGTASRVRRGYGRSVLIGAAFSIAWSPCVGPILGVVLTLAAATGTVWHGALLLAAYSAGLGVWFIAFGASIGWLGPRLRAAQPQMHLVMIGAGVLFIVVGSLMFLGEFTKLNQYARSFGFLFEQTASTETRLSGNVGGAVGPAIAFFGGMVSFLSPCVLPLVPVYLANLAGEAVFGTGDPRADRRRVLSHAAAFVAGFAVVFIVLGASAGLVGTLLQDHLAGLTRVSGLVMVLFGMQMSGLIHVGVLERTYQLPAGP